MRSDLVLFGDVHGVDAGVAFESSPKSNTTTGKMATARKTPTTSKYILSASHGDGIEQKLDRTETNYSHLRRPLKPSSLLSHGLGRHSV